MNSEKKLQFTCQNCGSKKLGYKKYVQNITPVELKKDGTVLYWPSHTNEDDFLATQFGFCCCKCKTLIDFCGCEIETEKELLSYLMMDPDLKKQQEKEYEKSVEAEITAQEQNQQLQQEQMEQELAEMVKNGEW